MKYSTHWLSALLLFITCTTSWALKVASLHPLLSDIVSQVGGEHVQVVKVAKPGFDVHKFQPSASDVRRMSECRLIFASGKDIEPYLDGLADSLTGSQKIIEVGRTLPSLTVGNDADLYRCCPTHSHGSLDPHWWHNVKNMERATKVIAKALSKADPDHSKYYSTNAKAAAQRLRQLNSWVKKSVAQIPKKQRHLVTSHAAFGYFCAAYGFKASFVQGLSREGEISSLQLKETIQIIVDENIKAVFPELASNPKILKQIAKSTGAKISAPLIADGSIASYEEMIRNNVTNIVTALK